MDEIGKSQSCRTGCSFRASFANKGQNAREAAAISKSGAPQKSGPDGQLDEACAGERTLADQLSTAWNLEIENKLAQQIESFAG